MARQRSPYERAIGERLQQDFGSRLKAAREERGVYQKRIAAAMGLTRTSISNIEQGRRRVFLDQVYQLAHCLGVPLDALLPEPEAVFVDPQILTVADDPMAEYVAREAERVLPDVLKKLNRTVATLPSSPDEKA